MTKLDYRLQNKSRIHFTGWIGRNVQLTPSCHACYTDAANGLLTTVWHIGLRACWDNGTNSRSFFPYVQTNKQLKKHGSINKLFFQVACFEVSDLKGSSQSARRFQGRLSSRSPIVRVAQFTDSALKKIFYDPMQRWSPKLVKLNCFLRGRQQPMTFDF